MKILTGAFLAGIFTTSYLWSSGTLSPVQASADNPVTAVRHVATAADLASEAGTRYRCCQPRHWRHLVFNR